MNTLHTALTAAARQSNIHVDFIKDAHARKALADSCKPTSNFPGSDARKVRATEPVRPYDTGTDACLKPRRETKPIRQWELIRNGRYDDTPLRERAVRQASLKVIDYVRRQEAAAPVRTHTRACPECFINLPAGSDVCDFCGDGVSHTPAVSAYIADDYLLTDA